MKEFKFTIDGQKYTASVNELENNVAEVVVNGKTYSVTMEKEEVAKPVVKPVAKPAASAPAAAPASAPAPKADVPAGGTKIVSPLPGSIIKVIATEGQAVKKGETLLTLESMKMENTIVADCDGTVSKILVSAGQSVMQGDVLIVIG